MTNRFARELNFGKKLLLAAVATVAVAGPVVIGLMTAPRSRAQMPAGVAVQAAPAAAHGPEETVQATQPAAPSPAVTDQRLAQPSDRPVFDVASIRPSDPDAKGGWARFLPGGRFEVLNAQLIFVIQQLYGVRDFQIVDAPKWIVDWNTARFNIEAKAEGVASQDQLRLMAKNLLEDRFQLKLHRETRDLPVYVLTQGKDGAKFKVTPDNGRPIRSGFIEPVERGWIQGANINMDNFVLTLSRYTDRPVVDRTNYTEAFTFKLQWAAEESPGRGASAEDAPPDMARPSLFTAVQEQMGLKLVSQKAPVEVLVIDHVERPSEN